MNTSLMPVFTFILVLTVVMAVVAFIMSQRKGQGFGNSLLESGIWSGSLIACSGADYLVVMLRYYA